MIPALFGMEHLRGAFSDKRCAARADCFAIGAAPGSVNMDSQELETIFAVAQFILLIHVIAAPRADKKTQSLRMIHIKPVTARPAFVYFNIIMTVIDHLTETAFVTYHRPSPYAPRCDLSCTCSQSLQQTLCCFL